MVQAGFLAAWSVVLEMLGAVEGLLCVVCIGHVCLTGGVSSVEDIDELGSVEGVR